MCRCRLWAVCLFVVLLCGAVDDGFAQSYEDPAEKEYFRARKLYRRAKKRSLKKDTRKQLRRQAYASFEKTLSLLTKRRTPTKRAKHLLTLGECDIYYHLAKLSLADKQPRTACRVLKTLQDKLATVPKRWKRWRVNRLLPGRFREAKTLSEICPSTPSILTLKGLPKKATVSIQRKDEQGKLRWQKIKLPLKTTKTSVTLLMQAPDYLKKEQRFSIERWRKKTFEVSLKKKPKPRIVKRRVVVRRRVIKPRERAPVKPKPGIKPWVWAAVGGGAVLIAGGVTAAVILANTPPSGFRPKIVQIDVVGEGK